MNFCVRIHFPRITQSLHIVNSGTTNFLVLNQYHTLAVCDSFFFCPFNRLYSWTQCLKTGAGTKDRAFKNSFFRETRNQMTQLQDLLFFYIQGIVRDDHLSQACV